MDVNELPPTNNLRAGTGKMLTAPNLRSGDPVPTPPRRVPKKIEMNAVEKALAVLRAQVKQAGNTGIGGEFSALGERMLLKAPSYTAIVVVDTKRSYPERSFVKIKNRWIRLIDGSTITPSRLVASGRKLSPKYSWTKIQLKK